MFKQYLVIGAGRFGSSVATTPVSYTHLYRLCQQLAEELDDCAVVERKAKLEGRNMTMILSPKS